MRTCRFWAGEGLDLSCCRFSIRRRLAGRQLKRQCLWPRDSCRQLQRSQAVCSAVFPNATQSSWGAAQLRRLYIFWVLMFRFLEAGPLVDGPNDTFSDNCLQDISNNSGDGWYCMQKDVPRKFVRRGRIRDEQEAVAVSKLAASLRSMD